MSFCPKKTEVCLLSSIPIQTHSRLWQCKPLSSEIRNEEGNRFPGKTDFTPPEQHSAVQSLILLTHIQDWFGVVLKSVALSRRISPLRTPIISLSHLSIQLHTQRTLALLKHKVLVVFHFEQWLLATAFCNCG